MRAQRIYPPATIPTFQETFATVELALQHIPAEPWVLYLDPELGMYGVYAQRELNGRGSWIRGWMIERTSESKDETTLLEER